MLALLLSLMLSMPARAGNEANPGSTPQLFVHNGPESRDDTRYDYHWTVLRAALDVTKAKYGPYTLSVGETLSETRQLHEMQRSSGLINTLVIDATVKIEKALFPVKIPIDKGLLGYRVFLIRAEDQPKFSKVKSLDDLKKFSIGQGSDWSDVEILKAAGFHVVGSSDYDALFRMLMGGRFDIFCRGVTEVRAELDLWRKQFPNMVIEKSLLLYYPLPSYFWFPRTAEGMARAQ